MSVMIIVSKTNLYFPMIQNQESFGELINQKPNAPNDCVGTLNQVMTSELDNSSWSSILIANDQNYSKGGSNQHNTLFAENEGSSLAFENHVAEDSIPMVSLVRKF